MRKKERSRVLYSDRASRRMERHWSGLVLGLVLITFVVAVAFASRAAYSLTRQAARALPNMTAVDLPKVILPAAGQESQRLPENIEASPLHQAAPLVASPNEAVALPFEQPEVHDRITILLLGVDQRPDDPSPPRTDNVIVVTIDPDSGQAGMISLPRDLFVPIPGFDRNRKINTAYVMGESSNYPGGGGELAKKTVGEFLGYPIDYYIKLNFDGFEKVVDLIGGIDVDVAQTIHDDQYPTLDYGYTTFHIDAGLQHLDGETALKYVRTRNADSDFERSKRQQQVLLAIKDKALEDKLLTTLRVFDLMDVLADSLEHDIPAPDLLNLVGLAGKIEADQIDQLVLDTRYGQIDPDSPYGWILIPDRSKIRPAVDQIFARSTPSPNIDREALARLQAQQRAALARQQVQNDYQAQAEALRDQLVSEGARVGLYNGTGDPNLTARVADWLGRQGYNIVEFGDADRSDYPRTVLVVQEDNPFTIANLTDSFAIAEDNIRYSGDRSDADLRLIVGRDFYLLVSN